MKKLILITIICLLSKVLLAQTTTIYASGPVNSYTTGRTSATTRSDNNIRTNGTTFRGYAVFDLSSLPAGVLVTSCTIGFNVATYGGTGTPSGWTTYGYAGDLSTVTTASTLYAALISGTSISTATYGTSTGNKTLSSTSAMVSFLNAHLGEHVSICFTGGSPRNYVITGETGTSATTGTHAPYMQINYCYLPTGVTASASSTTLCAGSTLNLSGTATDATSYTWSGPGGFTSTDLTTSFSPTSANSGIYTLTATNSCGSTVATTASVTIGTPATAITGTTSTCTGYNTTLSNSIAGGTWSSGAPSIANVDPSTGVVNGVSVGSATIYYTTPGCSAVSTTVNVASGPGTITAIATPLTVCDGGTISLSGSVSGSPSTFTWSGPGGFSATGATASLTANTSNEGIYTLTATNSCGSSSQTTGYVTVTTLPETIVGANKICNGSMHLYSEPTGGGSFSSTSAGIVSISSSGTLTAGSAGTGIITYTLPSGCRTYKTITVETSVSPTIAGIIPFCAPNTITVGNSVAGGIWSTSNTSVATISSAGVVYGNTAGTTYISYTNSCGTASAPLTINNQPAAITGESDICFGYSRFFYNTTPGGTWSSSEPGVANVSSAGYVTAFAPGTTDITYSTGLGCEAVIEVSVHPSLTTSVNIAAAPGTVICSGSPVTLTASPTNGGTSPLYFWTIFGDTVATGPVFSDTLNPGEIAICSMVSSEACPLPAVATATSALTIVPIVSPSVNISASVSDTNVNALTSVIFYAEASYGGSGVLYQWYKNNTPITGATNNTYTEFVINSFSIKCKITSNLPCADTNVAESNTIKINAIIPSGIDETATNTDVKIFPNPSIGIFSVSGYSNSGHLSIECFDVSGRIQYADELNNITQYNKTIDLSNVANGVYVLKLYDGEQQTIKRIVINK